MPKLISGDGKGSLTVPAWFLAVIGILFFLTGAVASFVTAQNSIKNDIDNANKLLDQHETKIQDVTKTATECDKITQVIDNRLKNIESSISKIEAKLP